MAFFERSDSQSPIVILSFQTIKALFQRWVRCWTRTTPNTGKAHVSSTFSSPTLQSTKLTTHFKSLLCSSQNFLFKDPTWLVWCDVHATVPLNISEIHKIFFPPKLNGISAFSFCQSLYTYTLRSILTDNCYQQWSGFRCLRSYSCILFLYKSQGCSTEGREHEG